MKDPRRTLILRLRRNVKVSQRFDVSPDPNDPLVEIQTCRECGFKETYRHSSTPEAAKKMIAYRSRGGVTGVCKRCSKKAAEERYPL